MDRILDGLEEQSAVVITGPSGVGKSAVLWAVPLALPGVVWYRVRRLLPEDVQHLIRLARAFRAAPERPVGFLVDAAGTDDFSGWDRLRSEARAVPGVLLVATARVEDLFTLGDLSGCCTVTIQLNHAAAETIFKGLKRRSATTEAHWVEAFNQSNGLTLEFTHLLTRGKRLHEIIGGQVKRRIRENRNRELEVLRLVSVADRWSASLSTADVVSACRTTNWEMRKAMERLAEEHLLVERNGTMSGLHQLRSTAISDIIHSQPPPDLNTTIRKVLPMVPGHQLHRFIANLLRDVPSARATVTDGAAGEGPQLGRIAAYLQGLRLADIYEVATPWNAFADERKIPASCRPFLFFHVLAGLQLADFMPDELLTAQEALQAVPIRSSHSDLVSQIGEKTLARLLVVAECIKEATQLLAVLEGGSPTFATDVKETLDRHSPLARTLRTASMDQIGECLAAARFCDPSLAESLLNIIGGTDLILERLRVGNPWITELDIRTKDDETIAFARILHVSEAVQGDAREGCVALGQILLRCLPHIQSVDIQALAPGGHELRVGDFTHGISHLESKYDYSETRQGWNQARMREAHILLGDTDTNRLSVALPLLQTAADLTKELATVFLIGKTSHLSREEFKKRVWELHNAGRELKPPLGPAGTRAIKSPEKTPALIADHLYSLIIDLTGNVFLRLGNPDQHRLLAPYISNTVLRHLDGALNEPWSLVGIDGHPQSLDQLRDTLNDLYAVVNQLADENSNSGEILNSARSGKPQEALRRAAGTSRRQQRQHIHKRHRKIQELCDATGLTTKVLHRQQDRPVLQEFAITVQLDSLLGWLDAVTTLHEVLSSQQPVGETYVLVPLRKSRPVPKLAMKLYTSLWPSPELGDWAAMLHQPWPSRLADRFAKAEAALEVLSGISHLAEDRLDHDSVQTAAKEAVEQLHAAHQNLFELPSDPLVATLVEFVEDIATRVQEELDGTHAEQSYIEQLAVAIYQNSPTDELRLILFYTYLALEWEIERETAIALLLSDE